MSNLKKPVLLFDGVCNLCVGSVQFIIKNEKQAILQFASLQSEFGQSQREKHQIPNEIDSLILIDNNRVYYYSSAALRITKYMGKLWPILQILLIIPPFLRNILYKWIAKNRYRWFGEKEMCWIPTLELNKRFLD